MGTSPTASECIEVRSRATLWQPVQEAQESTPFVPTSPPQPTVSGRSQSPLSVVTLQAPILAVCAARLCAALKRMSSRVRSYLRTARRSWGLSQQDLALLLGFKSRAHISRLERDERAPSLESLIACLVLFGTSTPELFPGLYSDIEETVLRHAAQLLDTLDGDNSLRAKRKRALLERALSRAISSSSS